MPYEPHETIAQRIKRAGLPETHRIHWSDQRKADVVRAVRKEMVDFHEVRDRYLLSHSEFRDWERKVDGGEIRQRESEAA
ncbi:MAG: DUF1153 domain-containing protein [Qipengyuania sp.]